jgi:hypothetical protein
MGESGGHQLTVRDGAPRRPCDCDQLPLRFAAGPATPGGGAWPGCPGASQVRRRRVRRPAHRWATGAEGRGWGSGVGPAVMVVLLDRDEVQVCSDVLREAGRRHLLGTTIPRRGWPRSRLGLNLRGHGRGQHPRVDLRLHVWDQRRVRVRRHRLVTDPTTRSSGTSARCCATSPSRAKPCPQPSCGSDFFGATMTARTVTNRWASTARSVSSLAPRAQVFLVNTRSDPTRWTTRRTAPGSSTGPGCHRRAPLRSSPLHASERWCGRRGPTSG